MRYQNKLKKKVSERDRNEIGEKRKERELFVLEREIVKERERERWEKEHVPESEIK